MSDEGVSDIFRKFDNWKDRWPDMEEGVELLDRIFLNYAIRKNQTVPFFDNRGRPQVGPHPDNLRSHHHVLRKYIATVKRFGVLSGVRGDPWAILSPDGVGPHQLITWGTLSRAIFIALEEDPLNPKILKSIAKGLERVVEFNARTPADIIAFLRDWHNRWNGGAEENFVDKLFKVKSRDAAWRSFCLAQGWTSRNCGKGPDSYVGRNWAWLQQHFEDEWPSMHVLIAGRTVMNFLEDRNFEQTFKTFMDSITMYDDSRLNMAVVTSVIRDAIVTLQHFEDSMSSSTMLLLIVESVRFMVPSSDQVSVVVGVTPSNRAVPFLFQKASDTELITRLMTEMDDSIVYNPLQKKRKPAAKSQQPPPKKNKTHAAATVQTPMPAEELVAEVAVSTEDGAKMRPKLWLDDVLQAVDSIFDGHAVLGLSDSKKQQLKAIFVSVCLQFAWTAKVELCGKPYTTWSTLRAALRESLHRTLDAVHAATLASAASTSADVESIADAAADAGFVSAGLASSSGTGDVQSMQDKAITDLLEACCSTEGGEDSAVKASHPAAAGTDANPSPASASASSEAAVKASPSDTTAPVATEPDGDKATAGSGICSMREILEFAMLDDEGKVPSMDGLMVSSELNLPTIAVPVESFNVAKFRCLFATIEAAIYNVAFAENAMAAYAKLTVDICSKDPLVVAAVGFNNSPSNVLPFAGTVSLTKTVKSFPIGVMKCGDFQSNIYLAGDSFGVLSSDPVVPAWLVKVVHTSVETSMHVERRFLAVDLPSSLVDSFGTTAVSIPVLRWASPRPVADEPVQLTRFEPALAKKKKAAGGKTGKKLAAAGEAEQLEPRDVIGCAGLKLKRSRAVAEIATAATSAPAVTPKSKAKSNKLVAHLLA
jgi:hypothetical protein